jgi:hypothetical protein
MMSLLQINSHRDNRPKACHPEIYHQQIHHPDNNHRETCHREIKPLQASLLAKTIFLTCHPETETETEIMTRTMTI